MLISGDGTRVCQLEGLRKGLGTSELEGSGGPERVRQMTSGEDRRGAGVCVVGPAVEGTVCVRSMGSRASPTVCSPSLGCRD